MAKDEHGNTDAIDWSSVTPTVVTQLKPARTVEDVPAPIRKWIDDAFSAQVIGSVTLPTEVAAKVFMREARDYAYMHDPRYTIRVTQQKDGVTVNFKVTAYVPLAEKQEAAKAAQTAKK